MFAGPLASETTEGRLVAVEQSIRDGRPPRGGYTQGSVCGRDDGARNWDKTKGIDMETFKAECDACDGSGLYVGCAEPKGTAVICYECDGTGCLKISFKPFIKRKGRRGIKRIIKHADPTGWCVTYREFQLMNMEYAT